MFDRIWYTGLTEVVLEKGHKMVVMWWRWLRHTVCMSVQISPSLWVFKVYYNATQCHVVMHWTPLSQFGESQNARYTALKTIDVKKRFFTFLFF